MKDFDPMKGFDWRVYPRTENDVIQPTEATINGVPLSVYAKMKTRGGPESVSVEQKAFEEDMEARVRLQDASPDLLAACKLSLRALSEREDLVGFAYVRSTLEKAIKKAEGK